MMLLVQGACCSNQWLAAVLLSLCCLLPSCLPAGQSVDFPWAAVDNMMVRKGKAGENGRENVKEMREEAKQISGRRMFQA